MEPPRENLEALQRLLALKRHETPPPGFFDRLPEAIRAELLTAVRRPGGIAGLWELMRSRWRLEPAIAGAMLLVVAGIYGTALLGLNGPAPAPATAATPLPSRVESPAVLTVIPQNNWLAESREDSTNASSLEPRTFTAPPAGLFTPGAGLRSVPVGFRSGPGGMALPQGVLMASNTTFQFSLPETFRP